MGEIIKPFTNKLTNVGQREREIVRDRDWRQMLKTI